MDDRPTDETIAWPDETEWVVAPQQARSRKTLGKILTAALTLFQDQGYAETTIADISRLSGMSVGAIYKRFADKEAILFAVLERYRLTRYERTDALLDPARWVGRRAADIVRMQVAVMFSAARHDRGFLRLVARGRIVNPRIHDMMLEWNDHYEMLIVRLLSPHAAELAVEEVGLAVHYVHNILRASLIWANLPFFVPERRALDIDSEGFRREIEIMALAYYGLPTGRERGS